MRYFINYPFFFFLVLWLMALEAKSQYSTPHTPFYVGGDKEKFYPVLWPDSRWLEGATELEITRSEVHVNGTWHGALVSKFRYHVSNWGHGANFIDADIKYNNQPFVAGWLDNSPANSTGSIIIWLRGGTNYYYRSTNSSNVSPTIYDGVANPLPYQQPWGTAGAINLITYKTAVEDYVNNIGLTYSGNAYFNGNSTNFFQGSVGIGTNKPSAMLNINPQGRGGILIGNPNTSSEGYTSLLIGISQDKSGYSFLQSTKSGGTSFGDIILNQSGGKVGIGTTNLSGDYRLFVKEGIRAEKIKVEVASQNGWADYVFEPNYQLPTLSQVESFIKVNKHLPDVPSEKEVKAEGIDVAKMDAVLLKKIEELTLYVIEQSKILKDQQNQISEQSKSIQVLKQENELLKSAVKNIKSSKRKMALPN